MLLNLLIEWFIVITIGSLVGIQEMVAAFGRARVRVRSDTVYWEMAVRSSLTQH